MPIPIYLVLGVILLSLQTSLLQAMPAWLGKPDLLFLLIVFLAYRLDLFRGALVVFLLGVILDIYAGIFLGLYPVIYLIVFFTLKGLFKYVAVNETAYQAPVVAASYLLAAGGIYLFSSILGGDSRPEWAWGPILLQLLLLAILTMPFFGIFDFFWNRLGNKKIQWRLFRKKGNRFRDR